MGDDVPPDELNHLSRARACTSAFRSATARPSRIPTTTPAGRAISSPHRRRLLGPHVAAHRHALLHRHDVPREYRGSVFIAEHGSWNRSKPIGYRVTFVKIEGGRAISYEPFAEGWLKGSTAGGRPADVLVMPDGALLVADDKAGRIYRISYSGGS